MKNGKSVVLALCLASVQAWAQHVPTLEEAVYGGLLDVKGGSSVNWLPEGGQYTRMEKCAKGGYDIVAYKPGKSKGSVLIPASMLVKRARTTR